MSLSRLRHSLLLALVLAACLGSTACNTIEGAGRDLERAGEEIQEEARD